MDFQFFLRKDTPKMLKGRSGTRGDAVKSSFSTTFRACHMALNASGTLVGFTPLRSVQPTLHRHKLSVTLRKRRSLAMREVLSGFREV